MIDSTKLLTIIDEIVSEKQIGHNLILESIKEGIKKAYEKHFDPEATIVVDVNQKTGQIKVDKELTVVKKVEDDLLEIGLNEAKAKYGDQIMIDDKVYEPINSEEFSRLAIFQVGQIIKQQIKEAEKDSIFDEYIVQKGHLIHGIVISAEEKYLLVEVERTFAYIPRNNLIFSDHFEVGQAIIFLAEDVVKSKNAGQITGSRTSNDFLYRLLEREIPEIFEQVINVKAISRDPGRRSKVAVYSTNDNIDPIGACVGSKGSRINKVTTELQDEKIDICVYNDNSQQFIINSLSPVKVISIITNEEGKEADVVVPDEQLSLAIGKGGSTAKLVANLTKWKINIMSYNEALTKQIEILWNGNLTAEELTDLQVKLKNKIKSKTAITLEPVAITAELPIEEFEIIEEQMAEETLILGEENYHVDDLTEEKPAVLVNEIEENLSYFETEQFENQDDEEGDGEINYEDYDDYYDQDK
ncbi:transcription termination factor NusA [Spiroplasma endosymbiont of Polydrusus formosus]|uniref:transcription termination factor NusA n=1 Tax=Spiroplasma endosymbiont of Polydrusus formosus TaxID=3139326 RepID=UPI0035B53D61